MISATYSRGLEEKLEIYRDRTVVLKKRDRTVRKARFSQEEIDRVLIEEGIEEMQKLFDKMNCLLNYRGTVGKLRDTMNKQSIPKYSTTLRDNDTVLFNLDCHGNINAFLNDKQYNWYTHRIDMINFLIDRNLKENRRISEFILEQLELMTNYDIYYRDNDREVWINRKTGSIIHEHRGYKRIHTVLPESRQKELNFNINCILLENINKYLITEDNLPHLQDITDYSVIDPNNEQSNHTFLIYHHRDSTELHKYYWISPGDCPNLNSVQETILDISNQIKIFRDTD